MLDYANAVRNENTECGDRPAVVNPTTVAGWDAIVK